MDAILDKFFFVFHTAIIILILFGWMWRKTRLASLVASLLTAFSWTFLGIWFGFGYCPSTDWHWQVRMRLGHHDLPSSYTKFLIDSLTGLDVSAKLVDILAVTFLGLALIASILTNLRDWRKRHKSNSVRCWT